MSVFPGKVLLATDGSEDSVVAARAAMDLSNETGAELHVMHVAESYPVYSPATGYPLPRPSTEELREAARTLLTEQVRQVKEAGGEVTADHLEVGRPAEEILRLSERIVAGLIVVGNQGLSGRFGRMRRFLMGSVSENVTRYARCSVMVVRRDLYERPPT